MRQLGLIRAISLHGSLSGAARALNLSQPALTKSLHELERAIDESLFERHPRGVRPTSAGLALLEFANRTLAELERLNDTLDQLGAPGKGLVVLGALPVAAAGLLPSVIKVLRRDHPSLELRMVVGRTEDLLPKLFTGELDIVLGQLYAPEVPDGLTREALYDEPISVIARAGHPIFSQGDLTNASLAEWDLVLPTFGQRLGRDIEHLIETLCLTSSPRLLRSTSHLFIREMLHESDMLTVAPRMLVAGDLMRGSLRVVNLVQNGPPRPAGLIIDGARGLPTSAQLLVQTVRAVVADLTSGPNGLTGSYDPAATRRVDAPG